MPINNREELNSYYQFFNTLVDEYTENWKIKPSNLKRYLQPGTERFNKFLEKAKYQVKQKWGVEINDGFGRLVLQNVLEDRFAMEKDGVLNFNKFQILESNQYKIDNIATCLWKGIGKADGTYEKFLADFFDTNLSQITIVSPSNAVNHVHSLIASSSHLFEVTTWGEKWNVIVWSSSDFELIRENIKEYLYTELTSRELDISGMKLNLSRVVDENAFSMYVESLLSPDYLINLVSECLVGFGFDSKSSSSPFLVWKHVSS